jgi:hypothetical protein
LHDAALGEPDEAARRVLVAASAYRIVQEALTRTRPRPAALRIIGYSPTAGFVITIIATGTTHAGVTAWKSSGADLRDYEGQG